MKRLFILRHADSIPGTNDKIRPLSKEGHKELKRLISKEPDLFKTIDIVLCSSSTRTRETLAEVNNCLRDRVMVNYIDALYHALPEIILEELRFVDDKFTTILVIAHNPGVTEFMRRVCEQQGEPMDKSMKTGSLAEFTVEGESWHALRYTNLKFVQLIKG